MQVSQTAVQKVQRRKRKTELEKIAKKEITALEY